jgi:hypothetical protein
MEKGRNPQSGVASPEATSRGQSRETSFSNARSQTSTLRKWIYYVSCLFVLGYLFILIPPVNHHLIRSYIIYTYKGPSSGILEALGVDTGPLPAVEDAKDVDWHPPPSEPTSRVMFGALDQPSEVRCWPSTGGVYVLEGVSSVELDFLGLDRFTAADRSYDHNQEDRFCKHLRMIGADWYEDYQAWVEVWVGGRETEQHRVRWALGWPADGGVWYLRLTYPDFITRKDLGRLRNAWTMEERCRAIEMSGGKLCEDISECNEISHLLP